MFLKKKQKTFLQMPNYLVLLDIVNMYISLTFHQQANYILSKLSFVLLQVFFFRLIG